MDDEEWYDPFDAEVFIWVDNGWLHVEHGEAKGQEPRKVVKMKIGNDKDKAAVIALIQDPNMWVKFLSSLSLALNSGIDREVVVD